MDIFNQRFFLVKRKAQREKLSKYLNCTLNILIQLNKVEYYNKCQTGSIKFTLTKVGVTRIMATFGEY